MQLAIHDRRNATPDPALSRQRRGRAVHALYPYLLVASAYLLLSVIIWWDVWTGHPASSSTCGCGDASSSIWFTSWPAHAIPNGQNPLFSTTVGYPTGINLIFAAFGVVLAPVTWLVGPVAALNVGLTVSPVLSALAMFALARRWVFWSPAAFVAGAFYGFSPFVLSNLSVAHVDFSMIAIPPLVVICLDELLIRQRRNPIATGITLGLLITAEFFVGLEVLILMTIEAAIGILLIVAYAARQNPAALRLHARSASKGIVASVGTALVLLAYPMWFGLAGPAHFSGSIHPGLKLTGFGASVRDFLFPVLTGDQWQHIVGGYQGPVLSSMLFSVYLGAGVFAVSIVGLVIWRGDRRLWLFGVLAFVSLVLVTSSGPWLASVPLLRNIVPQHFVVFAYLSLAVMLALILEHARKGVNKWWERSPSRTADESSPSARRVPLHGWSGPLAAGLVAAVAIVQPAVYLARTIPMTVEPIILPTWFSTVAPTLLGHPVLLALPAPFTATKASLTWTDQEGQTFPFNIGWKQAALTWQALGGQRTSIVGSGGLGAGLGHRAGEDQGQNVITRVTFAYASAPDVNSADMAAVHRSLSQWGVTTVVLPDQPELPAYDQVASITAMAALITGATGARPVHTARAWVWNDVHRDVPTGYPSASTYAGCVGTRPGRGVVAVDRTVSCMLASQA